MWGGLQDLREHSVIRVAPADIPRLAEAHIAWQVDTPADVKAYYERFKAQGVPIHHCVSHAYEEMGNTVSCYFLDPEGNRLEVYALVPERDEARMNRPLDLDKSLDEIISQASGLGNRGP